MKLPISKLANNTGQIDGVPANPRTINKDDYKKLLKSLQDDIDFLNHKPLHVYEHNGKYIVLGGNQRLKALRELGHKDVPVTVYKPETPVEVLRRRVIVDNSTFGDYDMDMLGNEWDDEPLDDWGVDLPDDWLGNEDEVVEDEAPEVSDEPPKSKLGEIYQLGRHRVMCGSATEASDVLALIGENHIDMVFTDPPYGIGLDKDGQKLGKSKSYGAVLNDADNSTALEAIQLLKKTTDCTMFVWGGNYFTSALEESPCWVVWDKQGGKHVTYADIEMCYTNIDAPSRLVTHIWDGFRRDSERGDKRTHPTQKPVQLIADIWKLMENYITKGPVLDVFLGSGSTLIACEQTDRTCFGMELDPKYVDVIRKRYHKFVTGSEEGWENGTKAVGTQEASA